MWHIIEFLSYLCKTDYFSQMDSQQIVDSLIAHDEQFTQRFFFKECRPLFVTIIRKIFDYEVDYDEFVNELYIHIMEDDARRLRQFQARSSIYQWLKVVAIRYFLSKHDKLIEERSEEPLIERSLNSRGENQERKIMARMDVEYLLERLGNKRYAYVLRRLILEDAEAETVAGELGVTVYNLYNIKKRAIDALSNLALNGNGKYEEGVSKG